MGKLLLILKSSAILFSSQVSIAAPHTKARVSPTQFAALSFWRAGIAGHHISPATMGSNLLQPVLKTADEFIDQVSRVHVIPRDNDGDIHSCMICHQPGDDIETMGILFDEIPFFRSPDTGIDWTSVTFFQQLPCCSQLVHVRCLVKHIKGISKHRSECFHCGTTLCIADALTPRQRWEAAAEDQMADVMMDQTDGDIDLHLWMWMAMKVYDIAESMCRADAHPHGQGYFGAVERIINGCGGFHDQYGDDAVLCLSQTTRGKEWLNQFVSAQMRNVLLNKGHGAITQDLDAFLIHARDSDNRLSDSIFTSAHTDDGNSDYEDQSLTSELSSMPGYEPSQDSPRYQRDRQRSRLPQRSEDGRSDRFRNYNRPRDPTANQGAMNGGNHMHFHNCTITMNGMSNDGGSFATGHARNSPRGRSHSRGGD
jgi:hypothetical protein